MRAIEPGAIIAVTGVTSALGGGLCNRLIADGYHVRGLLRAPRPEWRDGTGFTPVIGDLSDEIALARLVKGASGIVHIAAMFRTEGAYADFIDANVLGTERLLTCGQRVGAARFVHCSTIGVHGSLPDTPSNEDAPFDPRDDYQRTKLMGEQAARGQVGQSEMEIVIIRPAAIYGVGDMRMLKLFRMLKRGIFVQIGSGKANFHPVFIDDLVDGFLSALTTPGIDGETFILAGPEYMPLREYIATAAATIGVSPPRLRVPYKPVEWLAHLSEAVSARLGMEPMLHRRRLSFFKHNRAFDITHARDRLGYAPKVRLAEGFKRMVAGYRKGGLL